MPADFLSRNAVDAVGIFDGNWKISQEQDGDNCQILICKATHAKEKDMLVQPAGDFKKSLHRTVSVTSATL